MKRYGMVVGVLIVFFMLLFLLVEKLEVPVLVDPSPWLERGYAAALTGVALLIVDVVLPVPSSLVMIVNGALFGVAVGAALSLIGSVGATLVGFAIGRYGAGLFARFVPPDERARADKLLESYGTLAILVTRPVPLLAETVAIMAGASPLGWQRTALAALLGSLPGALLYALAGAVAASFQSAALVFGLVILVAGLFWLAGRWLETRLVTRTTLAKANLLKHK